MSDAEKQIKDTMEKYPRTEKREKRPEHQYDSVLPMISAIVGISTGYAMHAILPGSGIEHKIQVGFYAAASGGLSYIGNKLSIHKGALLAARGDRPAISATVGWFAVFGTMVGTLAFSGMSYKIVRDAILRDAA